MNFLASFKVFFNPSCNIMGINVNTTNMIRPSFLTLFPLINEDLPPELHSRLYLGRQPFQIDASTPFRIVSCQCIPVVQAGLSNCTFHQFSCQSFLPLLGSPALWGTRLVFQLGAGQFTSSGDQAASRTSKTSSFAAFKLLCIV